MDQVPDSAWPAHLLPSSIATSVVSPGAGQRLASTRIEAAAPVANMLIRSPAGAWRTDSALGAAGGNNTLFCPFSSSVSNNSNCVSAVHLAGAWSGEVSPKLPYVDTSVLVRTLASGVLPPTRDSNIVFRGGVYQARDLFSRCKFTAVGSHELVLEAQSLEVVSSDVSLCSVPSGTLEDEVSVQLRPVLSSKLRIYAVNTDAAGTGAVFSY